MTPKVDYVGFSGALLVRERWQLTSLFCPRCGKGNGHVWTKEPDPADPPSRVGMVEVRLFMCIGCAFTGYGWGGFRPNWNVQDRARQIIEIGFGAPNEDSQG